MFCNYTYNSIIFNFLYKKKSFGAYFEDPLFIIEKKTSHTNPYDHFKRDRETEF